jgi:hypothetical protein
MDDLYSDEPFAEVTSEANSVMIQKIMRDLERKYFPGVSPILDLEITSSIDGPAELIPTTKVIRINSQVAGWSKLSQVVILHELIHHFLLLRDGDPDTSEGQRFQTEIKRLWEEGAYTKIL